MSPSSPAEEVAAAPDPTTEPPVAADTPAEADPACALATPEMVAAAFGGTVSDGVPGQLRNCTYQVTGGSVTSLDVFYYGTAAEWGGIRQGFEDNRGGTTDITGVSEQAFTPGDNRTFELVVLAGDTVFEVAVFSDSGSTDIATDIVGLATAIAANAE